MREKLTTSTISVSAHHRCNISNYHIHRDHQTLNTPSEISGRIYSDNEITNQIVRVINEAKEQLAIVSP